MGDIILSFLGLVGFRLVNKVDVEVVGLSDARILSIWILIVAVLNQMGIGVMQISLGFGGRGGGSN